MVGEMRREVREKAPVEELTAADLFGKGLAESSSLIVLIPISTARDRVVDLAQQLGARNVAAGELGVAIAARSVLAEHVAEEYWRLPARWSARLPPGFAIPAESPTGPRRWDTIRFRGAAPSARV